MKIKSTLLAIVTMAGLMSLYPLAQAYTGQQYAKEVKVSIAQARALAMKAYPGKIVSEELEKEKGGSGLRYSFDIKNGNVVHEVGIDAVTGKVLENDVDNDYATPGGGVG